MVADFLLLILCLINNFNSAQLLSQNQIHKRHNVIIPLMKLNDFISDWKKIIQQRISFTEYSISTGNKTSIWCKRFCGQILFSITLKSVCATPEPKQQPGDEPVSHQELSTDHAFLWLQQQQDQPHESSCSSCFFLNSLWVLAFFQGTSSCITGPCLQHKPC